MAFVRGKDILIYKMKKKKRENTLAIHSAKGWGKKHFFFFLIEVGSGDNEGR